MKPRVMVLLGSILALALAATTTLAQMQQPSTRPGAPPPGAPPAETKVHEVEGTVGKVDPAAKTVEVSRMLGILGTKLEVTGDTKIQVDGKDATIAEIREGAKVKASYETQNGKNVARSIDVKAEDKREPAAKPPGAPGTSPAPGTPGSPRPRTQ